MDVTIVTGGFVVPVMILSAILGGIMAGFFFAYSVSVALALERLSASTYTAIMQDINETVLNVVFGIAFFGAVVVPTICAALLSLGGDWTSPYGQLFLVGVAIYLIGTFAVTMRIHIPMNEDIAKWSPESPPDEWGAVRDRWARWNHVRTAAAVISFVLYVAAIASFGM